MNIYVIKYTSVVRFPNCNWKWVGEPDYYISLNSFTVLLCIRWSFIQAETLSKHTLHDQRDPWQLDTRLSDTLMIGAQWPSFWDSNYFGYSTGDRVWRYPNLFPVRVLIFGIIFFGTGSSTFIGTKFFRLWYNFFSSTNQTNGKFSGTGTKFPGNLRYL